MHDALRNAGRGIWRHKLVALAGTLALLGVPGLMAAHGAAAAAKPPAVHARQEIDGRRFTGSLRLTATAYGPSAEDNYPYGATDYYGQPLVAGDVAVDPSVIPLGSWLWITGYSFTPYLPAGGFLAHAVDEGGAIQGTRVDIYLDQPGSVVGRFGIQNVQAYVLQ